MTYFSSLNMIKAMRQVGAANTLFSNPMVSSMFGTSGAAPEVGGAGGGGPSPARMGATVAEFCPQARPGLPSDSASADVTLWTITDVAQWLDVLSLGQYKHVFAEAAVDGPFLTDLTDEVGDWRRSVCVCGCGVAVVWLRGGVCGVGCVGWGVWGGVCWVLWARCAGCCGRGWWGKGGVAPF
jgi:hypothetical protein